MTERVAAGVEDLPQDVTRHENVKKNNNNNNNNKKKSLCLPLQKFPRYADTRFKGGQGKGGLTYKLLHP